LPEGAALPSLRHLPGTHARTGAIAKIRFIFSMREIDKDDANVKNCRIR
jgi:hypothetical protein